MDVDAKIKDFLKLYELPLDELLEKAKQAKEKHFGNEIEFCSIISAKTGLCSENCKYCSQSAHNHAKIEIHPLLTVEKVKKSAISASKNGAIYFSIVTSGRCPMQKDFSTILEMVKAVNSVPNLKCCASLGILNKEQAKLLKEAGVARYHHNINTAESYHNFICSTHSFADRVATIKIAKEAGMEICSGVIIGMGESKEQRIEMALQLACLEPTSTPINILKPIKGTPLETYKSEINEEEILKTMCIFRIILPNTFLRFAGGRYSRFGEKWQILALTSAINGLIVGNMLTTTSAKPEDDKKLIQTNGFQLKK